MAARRRGGGRLMPRGWAAGAHFVDVCRVYKMPRSRAQLEPCGARCARGHVSPARAVIVAWAGCWPARTGRAPGRAARPLWATLMMVVTCRVAAAPSRRSASPQAGAASADVVLSGERSAGPTSVARGEFGGSAVSQPVTGGDGRGGVGTEPMCSADASPASAVTQVSRMGARVEADNDGVRTAELLGSREGGLVVNQDNYSTGGDGRGGVGTEPMCIADASPASAVTQVSRTGARGQADNDGVRTAELLGSREVVLVVNQDNYSVFVPGGVLEMRVTVPIISAPSGELPVSVPALGRDRLESVLRRRAGVGGGGQNTGGAVPDGASAGVDGAPRDVHHELWSDGARSGPDGRKLRRKRRADRLCDVSVDLACESSDGSLEDVDEALNALPDYSGIQWPKQDVDGQIPAGYQPRSDLF